MQLQFHGALDRRYITNLRRANTYKITVTNCTRYLGIVSKDKLR